MTDINKRMREILDEYEILWHPRYLTSEPPCLSPKQVKEKFLKDLSDALIEGGVNRDIINKIFKPTAGEDKDVVCVKCGNRFVKREHIACPGCGGIHYEEPKPAQVELPSKWNDEAFQEVEPNLIPIMMEINQIIDYLRQERGRE